MSAYNFTDLDGCTCHLGHPPCSFCTDTQECDKCGDRHYPGLLIDTEYGSICESCYDQNYLNYE